MKSSQRRRVTTSPEAKQSIPSVLHTEEYFRALIENASDLITILDVDGIIRYESPSLARVLGFVPDERIGKSAFDLVHKDDLHTAIGHFREGIQYPNKILLMECRFRHKNGTWRVLENTGVNLLGDRAVKGVVVNSRDITERKTAEQLLQHSEERYRIVAEAASDALITIDDSSTILFANPATEIIFGYAPQELLGKSLTLLMPTYLRHRHRAGIQSFVETRERHIGWHSFETQGLHKNMSELPLEISFGQFAKGSQRLFIGVLRDVSERKRAHAALEKSESKYRTLMEEASDGILTYKPEGKIIEGNRRLCEMLGYSHEELLRFNVKDLVPPEDLALRPIRFDDLSAGETLITERRVIRKDRTILPVEISGKMLPDGMLLGIVRDIRERKRTDEELRQSRRQLRALSAHLQSAREVERTHLAREIHDQLGHSLTSLKFELSWIKKRIIDNENEVKLPEVVDKIQSMTQLVDSTIKTVRKISTELRPGILDELGLIAAIEWQANEFQVRTGIVCECDLDSLEVVPDADRSTAIFRIIQEILTNVARHAQATLVHISGRSLGDDLVINVADNGKGIKKKELLNSSSLGILGMRERALFLAGDLSVQGLREKGTLVTLKIPLAPPTNDLSASTA